MNGIIQYLVFYDWLLWLGIRFSRVIHIVACISPSFLWLNAIPLYVYYTFYLFLQQLMAIWVVSICWLLWIMELWTFLLCCGHMFSFLLGIYRGVELLDHKIEELPNSCRVAAPNYIANVALYEGSTFSTSLPVFLLSF